MRKRVMMLALLTSLGGATSAWAILSCADYISGYGDDGPMAGHLIGEQLVTEEFSFGVDAGASAGISGTVQYYVGVYRMHDGTNLKIDCRDYSVA